MKRGDIIAALALLALAGLVLLMRPSGAGGVYVNDNAVAPAGTGASATMTVN